MRAAVLERAPGGLHVEEIPIPEPGRGEILVRVAACGVCHTDLGDSGEAASGYYRAPWQWQRIRDNQRWIAIYHSIDDPHIPAGDARFVASQLRCRYFEFTDRGHVVDEREFPEVVQFVRRQLPPPTPAGTQR